jgi:hypothetical protein
MKYLKIPILKIPEGLEGLGIKTRFESVRYLVPNAILGLEPVYDEVNDLVPNQCDMLLAGGEKIRCTMSCEQYLEKIAAWNTPG